ncbi:MAG TPA: redoxin domain-containing protein [Patescibacteria group bacterium]|nr:redoxin domain-containing protein [Patescibacteria group bacterium]
MSNSKIFIISLLLFSFLLTAFFISGSFSSVLATVNTCGVEVHPNNISSNSSGTLGFTIENNGGSAAIVWVKITSPSANFTINSGSSSGWSGNVSGSSITFTGGTQNIGNLIGYDVNVSTGAETAQASWTVQTSDSADGAGAVTCSGSTQVAISNSAADTTAPEIVGGITVTGVSDTSVNLTWTTDELATSTTNYGTTSSYGSNVSGTSLVTSHSITISGLSPNVTYHFSTTVSDQWGNSGSTDDNTFTISKGAATTITTTTTITNATTVTKILTDTSLPSVKITTVFTGAYKTAPEILGTATDNSGISFVEYSVDDGKNWATAFLKGKIGSKSTSFSFTPDIVEDGNYKIKVRATDTSGNIGISKVSELVIDRLPPLIGGNVWSIGPITLTPNKNGVITTLAGVNNRITMSAIGGPTSVDLYIGSAKYPMAKSVESGLWTGTINFGASGLFTVVVKSIDGGGNATERDLNSVMFVSSGKVNSQETATNNAKVTVYQQDAKSKIWSLWDALSFGQTNPQTTNDLGNYSYFLPSGTYYLKVTAPGFKKITTNIFKLDDPTAINMDFEMNPLVKFNFGPWSIAIPDVFSSTIDIALKQVEVPDNDQNNNSFIGKETPNFILPKVNGGDLNSLTLRGKPQVIIFLNSWLPGATDQILQVKSLDPVYKSKVSLIMTEENLAKITVFAKRGNYDDLAIAADPDGLLVTPYNLNTLPTSYFVDRKGIVQRVVTGIVTKDDIINYIDSI